MRSTGAHNLALPLFATSVLALFVGLLVALGSAPARAQDQYADQYQYQGQYQDQYPNQYQGQYQYQPSAPSQAAPPAPNGCSSYLLHPRGYGWRCSHIYTWHE